MIWANMMQFGASFFAGLAGANKFDAEKLVTCLSCAKTLPRVGFGPAAFNA